MISWAVWPLRGISASSISQTSAMYLRCSGFSIGAGYTNGRITVDVAYLYLLFNNRTINNSLADDDANPLTSNDALNGTYKSNAQLAGITIGYKF